MGIRIASVILSVAGLLALILGLLVWTGTAANLVQMHMLLGLLAVGALWVIAIGQAFAKGSWILGLCALVVGALTAIFGMTHATLMAGEFHWIVRVIHVVLGVLTIGLGHMAAARYKKTMSARV
jgi:hypothetical protein